MNNQFSVAIDGPVGAGKSTIAKLVAKKMNIVYIDTGAMYRTVALYVVRKGFDVNDVEAIKSVLDEISLEVKLNEKGQIIFLNGENVTELIRTPEISMAASFVSAVPEVRVKMVDMQRNMAKSQSVIMDGRDIGTVVLPNAELKIFLNATLDTRTERRYKELIKKGQNVSFDDVKNDIVQRDKNDMERETSPLKKADDAIELDTTGKTLDQVVEEVIELAKNI